MIESTGARMPDAPHALRPHRRRPSLPALPAASPFALASVTTPVHFDYWHPNILGGRACRCASVRGLAARPPARSIPLSV